MKSGTHVGAGLFPETLVTFRLKTATKFGLLSQASGAGPKGSRQPGGKRLSINLPPHLAYAQIDQLHEAYEEIVSEWGSRGLIIEHVEDMPEETLERHLSAALDVCGY